jgi:hypothetical protein
MAFSTADSGLCYIAQRFGTVRFHLYFALDVREGPLDVSLKNHV